jgi:hypothetical protein
MGSPTYPTPPANPEINSASPFYSTLAGLVMFNRGDAMPRGIVHNGMPHATCGYGGIATGPEGIIIPNSFPFNAAADGNTSDYSFRVAGNNRSRQWLWEGNQPTGGIPGMTIFAVFQFQDACSPTGGLNAIPIIGVQQSLYPGAGSAGAVGTPDSLCLYTTGSSSLYLAFSGSGGFTYSVNHPIIPGHWYAAAVTRSDQTGTGINGSFSLKYFMRCYLYDLTVGAIVGTVNGPGQSQPFTNNFAQNTTDHCTSNWPLTQYYSTYFAELVLPLGFNTGSTDGETPASILVKMAGVDSRPWDDSGFAYAIPGGFSGVDQFTYFVNNIYEMVSPSSSYATGSLVGDLWVGYGAQPANAAQGYADFTNGNVAIAGAASATNFVVYGDAVLTNVTNTGIQITCSRPQAAPSLPSAMTYNLYQYAGTAYPISHITGATNANPCVISADNSYTNGQQVVINRVSGMTQINNRVYTMTSVTGSSFALSGVNSSAYGTYSGSGADCIMLNTPIQTNTTGVFNYTPADNNLYYYLIVATDGTNYYVYNLVTASMNLLPDQAFAYVGNSVQTHTGNLPSKWTTFASALRMRLQALDFSDDGMELFQLLPSASVVFGVPAWRSDTNYYNRITAMLTQDVSYTGLPYSIIGQVAGNNLGQSNYAAYLTIIQNAFLALTTTYIGPTVGSLVNGQTVPVVNRVIWMCPPWQRGGHNFYSLASIPSMIQQQQSVSNGSSVLTLSYGGTVYTTNYPDDINGGHPDLSASRMQTMSLLHDLFLTGGSGAFASS